jgi:pimeloyl-ACP methyl ester carboxylesterase
VHIILIPGLWLDGASWDLVTPVLEKAGHRTHPITLPGLEAKDADRSGITQADAINAVTATIDSVDPAEGQVVVVGHSMGAGIASIVVDSRVDRVARAIYVGGFPAADGEPLSTDFPAGNGEVAMPDFADMDDADLADLDETALAAFRERSIPVPEKVLTDVVRMTDERRYSVPVTVICPEFSGATLRGWIDAGMAPVQEFTKVRDVTYIDVPTGHWPQFTRPEDLAKAIITSIEGGPERKKL